MNKLDAVVQSVISKLRPYGVAEVRAITAELTPRSGPTQLNVLFRGPVSRGRVWFFEVSEQTWIEKNHYIERAFRMRIQFVSDVLTEVPERYIYIDCSGADASYKMRDCGFIEYKKFQYLQDLEAFIDTLIAQTS